MSQIVGLINGTGNLNRDYHYSLGLSSIIDAGVISGLELSQTGLDVSITSGEAVVPVTRTSITPNEEFCVAFISTATETITVNAGNYVIIEVTSDNINDPSLNTATTGTGIGEIKSVSSLPTSNYIILGQMSGGGVLDLSQRNIVGLKSNLTSVDKITGSANKILYTDGTGQVKELAFGNSGQVLGFNGISSTPSAVSPSVDIGGLNETTTLTATDDFIVNQSGNKKIKALNLLKSTKYIGVAGENITAGNYIRKGILGSVTGGELAVQQLVNSAEITLGFNWTTNYEFGQSFTATKSGGLSSITVYLRQQGTDVDDYNIEVFSNEAFSTLLGTSKETLSSATGTSIAYTFNFTGISLTLGTTYYFKINKINGGISTTNYMFIQANTSNTSYTGGQIYSITNAGVTTAGTGDLVFSVIQGDIEDINKFYKTNASVLHKTLSPLVAENTVSSGGNITTNTSGTNMYQSGLVTNSIYYLSNTPGAISTTPGTNSVKIGRALSSTEILIIQPPL